MGALTSKERQALEDIFLSINTTNSHKNNIKHTIVFLNKSFKQAKIGAKKTKFYKFMFIFFKKKNNLSK